MDAHLGMWRSAAFSLKRLPQLGHGNKSGSASEGGGGGRSRPLLPAATASVYCRAARMACRRALLLAAHDVAPPPPPPVSLLGALLGPALTFFLAAPWVADAAVGAPPAAFVSSVTTSCLNAARFV